MTPKVVFFGEADYGKSTIIGYLYAYSYNIDLKKKEEEIRKIMGINYEPDFIFSSLVNSNIWNSTTTHDVKTKTIPEGEIYNNNTQIVKNTDDECIIQSTKLIGNDKVKITTTHHHKGIVNRLNTLSHKMKNVEILYNGRTIKFIIVDTPGHVRFLSEAELGISLSDIGVFCIPINEILKQDFNKDTLISFGNLWSINNYNTKIIYALTKFDLCDFSEEEYSLACKRIKQFCKQVRVTHFDNVLGQIISFEVIEDDVAAIVPVSVNFKSKTGENIIELSDKIPWYNGPPLLEAIIERMDEIQRKSEKKITNNLFFSIDKEISKTHTRSGKVWRIYIQNGNLKVGDNIVLTSVNIDGNPNSEIFDVKAEIKSIHKETDIEIEGEQSISNISANNIITIDIKNCIVGKKHIDKKSICVTDYTVGYSANEKFEKINKFHILMPKNTDDELELLDMFDHFNRIRIGQDIVLHWNGRRVPAEVLEILSENRMINIQIKHEKAFDMPVNQEFLQIDAFSKINFYFESCGKIWRYSGKLIPIHQ